MFIFCIIFATIYTSDCANILAVFPTASISHQVVFRPFVQELAKRGHEVTVITTDPAFPKGQAPQNLTEIDLHDISYNAWNEFLTSKQGTENDTYIHVRYIFEFLSVLFEEQMKSADVQNLINDKKKNIDLVFVESCIIPTLSFSYLYNVPVIEISSFGDIYGTLYSMGVPTHPFIYPILLRRKTFNLSFWDKILEAYKQFELDRMFKSLEIIENEMLKRVFGPNIPPLSILKENVDMLFLNVHPIWDFNRPVSPNIIYLGGMHQKPEKKLPEDLLTFLDSSKNGVIYMSFGTNVIPSLLPPEKIQVFTAVFSQLPYNVLWKWDKNEIPGRPRNVRISKWFPQSDLLRHPNMKLFITQGGLQSTDEAIMAGVPLIGIPILGDQWLNTEKYVIHSIGLQLSLETLTEEILENAIETVIGNTSYRENVARLRNIMNDQPQTSLERAVWWTEYVLRHKGAKHLRSAAANIPWTEYYALDLIIPLLFVLLFALISLLFLIKFLIFKINCWRVKLKTN